MADLKPLRSGECTMNQRSDVVFRTWAMAGSVAAQDVGSEVPNLGYMYPYGGTFAYLKGYIYFTAATN